MFLKKEYYFKLLALWVTGSQVEVFRGITLDRELCWLFLRILQKGQRFS